MRSCSQWGGWDASTHLAEDPATDKGGEAREGPNDEAKRVSVAEKLLRGHALLGWLWFRAFEVLMSVDEGSGRSCACPRHWRVPDQLSV